MRLMLSCSELGLGHVSRLIVLGKKLEAKGYELFFYSGGNAYKLLEKEFRNVYYCTPVGWYENTHGIIVSASILNILFPMPRVNPEDGKFGLKSPSGMETIHRYYDLRRNILKIKPDLIVSDSDLHALRLAHRWHFPSVYITNVIRPSYSFSPLLVPGERFTERYVKNCSKIIVPDIPPPYTICEYNLGSLEDVGVADKVEFVGSFIDVKPSKGGAESHIFAPISGPIGTRIQLKRIIIPVLSRLKTKSIISLGEHGKRKVAKIGSCTVYSWLPPHERGEFMANAKLVIFSGGHNTCFEVIKHAKPSICVPTQPEQLANAKKMQDLNCSIIARNKAQLLQAIREMEKHIDFYKKNVQKINQYCSRFKGVDTAVKIIEEVAQKFGK
jgi:UDP-N-acetylglucosamine--N-acetylmuramyl-(pentapeptide) pyrophosphoryl-undecaprenol N-acetylglucosamine transferase